MDNPTLQKLTLKTPLLILSHIGTGEFVCLRGGKVPGGGEAIVTFRDREAATLWRDEMGMLEFCDIKTSTPEEIGGRFSVLWWADDPADCGFYIICDIEA